MYRTKSLPIFERGLGRIKLAVKSTINTMHQSAPLLGVEPLVWDDKMLSQNGPQVPYTRSLADIGYVANPHPGIAPDSVTAVSEVQNLLSPIAVKALQSICSDLESHAGNSDWIISRRTRGVTALSTFIASMMNSRKFLLAVSRIAGVPLVPYPMVNARSQVNYFYPAGDERERQQLGMWHTDGTNFVLNILLSAQKDYTGGEFLFYNRPVETFDKLSLHDSTVEAASLPTPGDALFIYGSKLFHGVMPVTRGRRMSLVLSFHCPYTFEDSNRFWHLASDDGIPNTIINWVDLQRALRKPAVQQYKAIGIAPITFEELHQSEI